MSVILLALAATMFVHTLACNHTKMWYNGTISVRMFTNSQSCTHLACTGGANTSCVKLRRSPCENVDGNYVMVPTEWLRELKTLSLECADSERATVLSPFVSSAAECCTIMQTAGENIAAVAIIAAIVVGACTFGVVQSCRSRN